MSTNLVESGFKLLNTLTPATSLPRGENVSRSLEQGAGIDFAASITSLWQDFAASEENLAAGRPANDEAGAFARAGSVPGDPQDEVLQSEAAARKSAGDRVAAFAVLTPGLSSDFAVLNGTPAATASDMSVLNQLSDPLMFSLRMASALRGPAAA